MGALGLERRFQQGLCCEDEDGAAGPCSGLGVRRPESAAQRRAGDRGSDSCDTPAVTAPSGAFQGRGDGRRKTRLHAKRVLLPLSLRLLRTPSLFHCINSQLKPQPRLDLKPVLVQRPRFPRNQGSRTVLVLILFNLDDKEDKEIFSGKDFLSLYAFFISKISQIYPGKLPCGKPRITCPSHGKAATSQTSARTPKPRPLGPAWAPNAGLGDGVRARREAGCQERGATAQHAPSMLTHTATFSAENQ